jgi:hypothetical protein
MQFTALINHNFRNVNRLDQKVLLTSIINEHKQEFRDHFWANHNQVANFIPNNNLTTHLIMFEADIKPYPYDSTKHLLSNIRDIELLDTTTKYKRKRAIAKAE